MGQQWYNRKIIRVATKKLAGCVMLGKLFNLSEAQFPHI